MKFTGCLFAVKDITAAKEFYQELFGLRVKYDFGINLAFEGGLVLQENFAWLAGIAKEAIKDKENNCEICFETEDFDSFIAKLDKRQDIVLLHDVVEHSWGQRVIRFYDPNNHLIEVGENLKTVVERFRAQGMSMAEITLKMDVSEEDIQKIFEE